MMARIALTGLALANVFGAGACLFLLETATDNVVQTIFAFGLVASVVAALICAFALAEELGAADYRGEGSRPPKQCHIAHDGEAISR